MAPKETGMLTSTDSNKKKNVFSIGDEILDRFNKFSIDEEILHR